MMRRLANPFSSIEGYHCFACSSSNPHGLHMEFYEADDSVVCSWEPESRFDGFDSVLHGGIQATLMDEIASWYVFVKLRTAGVTSGMQIDFSAPVRTNQGPIRLEARLDSMEKNLAHIRVQLEDAEGKTCSVGLCTYFTYPEKIARKRLDYPGYEAFLPDTDA